jgi:hypothetical protein
MNVSGGVRVPCQIRYHQMWVGKPSNLPCTKAWYFSETPTDVENG